jgi:hypothetical protein
MDRHMSDALDRHITGNYGADQFPTPVGAWVVGSNMPGYLPEGDPAAFAEWADAFGYLVDELRRWGDEDDDAYAALPCDHSPGGDLYALGERCDQDGTDTGCHGSSLALVEAIIRDDLTANPTIVPNQDVTVGVVDNDDRPLNFFLAWSPDSDPDED